LEDQRLNDLTIFGTDVLVGISSSCQDGDFNIGPYGRGND